jgi:hypothetical protein
MRQGDGRMVERVMRGSLRVRLKGFAQGGKLRYRLLVSDAPHPLVQM